MKASIPQGGWLWFWRAHLAVFVGLFAVDAFLAFQQPVEMKSLIGSDLPSALTILLILLLAGGSIAGEAGYVFQRSFSTRGFWRALFVVFAILWVAGIALTLAIGVFLDPQGLSIPDPREMLEATVSAANLVAIWLYAYRCPHVWPGSIEPERIPT
jgi:hypothetical protein